MKGYDNKFDDVQIDVRGMANKTNFNFHKLNIPFLKNNEPVLIGLDVGYSSTKVVSNLGYHIFPSLVTPIEKQDEDKYTSFPKKTTLLYRDNNVTRKTWLVGDIIIEGIQEKLDNQDFLYGSNRIGTDENLVLNRVGLALALLKEDKSFIKNPEVRITVGLPAQYFSHENEYKSQLIGYHNFELFINGEWVEIKVDIPADDLNVMSQPMGTLFSLALNRQGQIIDEKLISSARLVIFDGGFGTVDTYVLTNGTTGKCKTWEKQGMRTVYERTLYQCEEETGRNLGFNRLNFILAKPEAERVVRYNGKNKWFVDPTVKTNIDIIAEDNIKSINKTYNYLNDVDLFIMTGGTGKVLYPYFKLALNIPMRLAEKTDSKYPEENFDSVFSICVGFFNHSALKYRTEINYDNYEEVIEADNEAAVTNI